MRMRMTWRCGRDPEAGSVLVFWGISIVVLLGMVALSFDIGRISATQSELQSYADNLAVAAAAELDGEADSIDRAIAAAETLITDTQSFGAGGRQLTTADYDLVFYQRGAGGAGAVISPNLATGEYTSATQLSARYVRAVVGPRNVGTPFAAVLSLITGNALASADVGAQAVAGLDEFACDITPLMFCVPTGWDADTNIGQMIRLRTGGQNAAWGPGNFGFLDPSKIEVNPGGPCKNLNGQQLDACLIAAERSTSGCFSQEGVDLEPGQKTGRNASAFNVVFDIYHSTMNGDKNNSDYRPAPNVIKGIKAASGNNNQGGGGGNSCIGNNYTASSAMPLPRDDCFATASCPEGNRFGTETWAKAAYVSANHTVDPTLAHPMGGDFTGTRYEMYRAEIAAGSAQRVTKPGLDETGVKSCAPTASPDPNRRVFVAAAIDCGANNIQGAAQDVPVQEFVRIFLTEPVGYATGTFLDTEDFDIHIEVLGSAEKDSAVGPSLIRKVVRLVE